MHFARYLKIFNWRLKRELSRLEQRVADLLYGRVQPGGKLGIFAIFLRMASWMFGGIVRLRLRLYQARLLRQQFLGCMVVVIGNITVGGTGKTPVVEKFAKALIAQGRKVAILSRGYKRQEAGLLHRLISIFDPEANAPIVVSRGDGNLLVDWRKAGDEPYMLAKNVPQAVVIVDKNRVKAGAYAIRKYGVDTILLDDGFQYLPLKSRLQLVLVDQMNPFGSGALLPRGILREPLQALRRASFIFITKSDGTPSQQLLDTLAQHGPTGTPIVTTHAPKHICSLDETTTLPLAHLAGKNILSFCGIATPASFERLLTAQGARLAHTLHFADHYPYDPQDIEQILSTASKAQVDMILTTEKDAVRLPPIASHIPIYYLRMEVEILSGAENFAQAVDAVCFAHAPQQTPPIF